MECTIISGAERKKNEDVRTSAEHETSDNRRAVAKMFKTLN